MKKFLIQVTIFCSFPVFIFMGIFLLADGYTDPYYNRFKSPDQSSLILGTSRAAQALKPSVFDSILVGKKMFNYSFTIGHSPYGPAYFESVKRKLDKDIKDGVFILAVDPWSLSSTISDPNNVQNFRENDRFMGNLKVVSMNPNIFYLINEYEGSYFRILLNLADKITGNPTPKPVYLQKDGWLDIDIPMDSISVNKRFKSKFRQYREEYIPLYKKSTARNNTLIEMISYLKTYGNVFLVRLPVPDEMFDIESELHPDFDEDMEAVGKELGVPYITFYKQGNDYVYTDGSHLYKSSAVDLSIEIATTIKSILHEYSSLK